MTLIARVSDSVAQVASRRRPFWQPLATIVGVAALAIGMLALSTFNTLPIASRGVGVLPVGHATPANARNQNPDVPRERHKRADYVIMPPDIIDIEVTQYGLPLKEINGQYLVSPDGIIELGRFGFVRVADVTLGDAQTAIASQIGQLLDAAEVTVSVSGQNSRVFYIVLKGGAAGDDVHRNPANGGETVLDAFHYLKRSDLTNKKIWIARPSPEVGADEILNVSADCIIAGTDLSTNYALLPGDRLFIVNRGNVWDFFR